MGDVASPNTSIEHDMASELDSLKKSLCRPFDTLDGSPTDCHLVTELVSIGTRRCRV